MENNNNYVLIKTDNNKRFTKLNTTRVPVSEEFYKANRNDINNSRQKMQYRNRCVCPHDNWYKCTTDCENCCYYRDNGMIVSLNAPIEDESGNETESIWNIPDPDADIQTKLEEDEMWAQLNKIIKSLKPMDRKILTMIANNMPEREMAEELHMPKTTFHDYKERLLKYIRKELEKYYCEF